MKFRGFAVCSLFSLVALSGLAISPAAAEDEGQKAELTAMLHDFLANSSTEAAHAKFWADDLVYTSSNGTRFGKDSIMEGFAASDAEEAVDDEDEAEQDQGPALVYTGEDVKVQVFGTTAIVTFRLVGTPDDGSANNEYFNSGTFLKRDDAWRVVSWQATIIPPGD